MTTYKESHDIPHIWKIFSYDEILGSGNGINHNQNQLRKQKDV